MSGATYSDYSDSDYSDSDYSDSDTVRSTHADRRVDPQVELLLNSVRNRLRAVLVLDRVERLLPGATVSALVLVALSRFIVAPWLVAVAAAVIVTALAVAVVQGWRVGLSDRTVAEVTDHQIGSRDAFSTAIEFADLDGPFGDQIRARAQSVASTTDPDDVTEVSPSRRRWAIIVMATAALLGLLALTPAKVHVPTPDELAEQSFKADAKRLREQADGLLATEPSPDAVTLAQQLNALAEQLDRADGLNDGLQKLDRARSELEASISDNFSSQQAAVQGLDRSVQNNPIAATGGNAAEQLEALAQELDSMTEQQRADLAERLDALAASQAAGSPEVAASLSSAAAALSSGDVAGAAGSLSAASSGQSAAGQSVSDQVARASASNALRDAAAHAQQASNSTGPGNRDSNGQGNGEGKTPGQGLGSGSKGNNGSPSGQVTGALGGTGQGQGGVGRANGTGASTNNTVNDSATLWLPGGESQQLDVSGADHGGEMTTVGKGQVASSSGGANVPIAEVIADYQQQAAEALNRDQIPPSSRELVQRYFDELAGNGP